MSSVFTRIVVKRSLPSTLEISFDPAWPVPPAPVYPPNPTPVHHNTLTIKGREHIRWFAVQIVELDTRLRKAYIDGRQHTSCVEFSNTNYRIEGKYPWDTIVQDNAGRTMALTRWNVEQLANELRHEYNESLIWPTP